MLSGLAAMVEDFGVVATSVFKGISKDSETGSVQRARGQVPIIVGGLCERQHSRCEPRRVEGDGAKGVAEDTADEVTLGFAVRPPCGVSENMKDKAIRTPSRGVAHFQAVMPSRVHTDVECDYRSKVFGR